MPVRWLYLIDLAPSSGPFPFLPVPTPKIHMRHQIDPEAIQLIADSRRAIEVSRRIIAQSRRDQEELRVTIAESRRMLEATRRASK